MPKFYFFEEHGYPICVLCGKRTGIRYCSRCHEYFCVPCSGPKSYPLRAMALIEKNRKKLTVGQQ